MKTQVKTNELEIDIHDRVAEAYYGELGEKMQEETQERMHWIRDNVIGNNILDVGCSQGIGPILLGKIGKEVTGVDISQKAVDEANEALSKEDSNVRNNVNFIKSDFLEYDAKKEKFDTITITEVLEHLYIPDEFISKTYDLLEDKGTIIVTVPFAINDFPDHKKTYYYHDLYQMIYRYFDIKKTTFFGRWIGFIGEKRPLKISSAKSIDLAVLQEIEYHFYKIDREQNDMNTKYLTQLNNANEKYRNSYKIIETQKKQIEKANEKYRNSCKIIETQKKQIEKANEKHIELSSAIADKDSSIVKIKNQITTIRKNLIIAEQYKKKVAEYHVSASYQLGYLLIHNTRSIKDILSLPKRLMDIKSQKKSKKSKKSKKHIKLKSFQTNKNISELKIACIMDPFTYSSYSKEAVFQQLTPTNWENELKDFLPDLLFIESAWRGKDELWWNTVGKKCDELIEIVNFCNKHKIPTAFWNKEDPVHFNTFINTATIFDFIFTTDIDMIKKYQTVLEHNRVFLLPFACQPKVNNPIEKYKRKDAFCFAGAYYVNYPDRTKDLDEFMLYLPNQKPVEIYDRNYGKDDINYMFPKEFNSFIVGTLPFDEIDKAYKGYNYAINLNSVKYSQSMFARRVFEVLASNTITISNYSKAVRLLFGDLVITSDNGEEIVGRVKSLVKDTVSLKKHKLIALRKVLSEHTYKDRLNLLVSKVFNRDIQNTLPSILMICFAKDKDMYNKYLEDFDKQYYTNKKLIVIKENFQIDEKKENILILDSSKVKNKKISELNLNVDYISLININDYYGRNYLTDLALATYYFDGTFIGKGSYYTADVDHNLILVSNINSYSITKSLSLYSSIIKTKEILEIKIDQLSSVSESNDINSSECLSIDEFNYCKNGSNLTFEKIDEIEVDKINHDGISINKLNKFSEKNQYSFHDNSFETENISSSILTGSIHKLKHSHVVFGKSKKGITISSTMSSDKHQNIYNPDMFNIDDMKFKDHQKVYLNISVGLDIMLIVVFSDKNKKKISHQSIMANKNDELLTPKGTKWIHFGFRIKGSGVATLNALELTHRVLNTSPIIGQSKHLILTNIYPSYDDLYRNGFVHSRVKAYQKKGIIVDVFSLEKNPVSLYREFNNIDVISGSVLELDNLLKNNTYTSILVHFLDESMWGIIEKHINKTKVYVWVHGAEIQPWHRRKFNYTTHEALEKAKIISAKRDTFWTSILKEPHQNLKLIFVSQYFAEEVQEDLKLSIPAKNMTVIHNYINTDLFDFIHKDIEQRKKILSIRPYASHKYANDLSVKAILELSKKPYFKNLQFTMIGDGVLFDETLEPLRQFDNVTIEKRFLSQSEIASLHKEYGLFLTPTRMDAQGVSRDEAMSSGLIPITNAITAIPEFVDDNCGILAKDNDVLGLSEGIARIYENPDLFQEMSEASANRVRNQCGFEHTIQKEIDLFTSKKKIMIFGSCVSRDIFNIPNDFILTKYYARSSFASIFQAPFLNLSITDNLKSDFQKNIVKADMSKEILIEFDKGDFDILLLDFIDERFNLFSIDNTVFTLSNEAISTSIEQKYPNHTLIKSGNGEFMKLWQEGWDEFVSTMKKSGQLHKVILNKVYWSKETLSGEDYAATYTNEKIDYMNSYLDRLYVIAEKSILPENIMSFKKDLMLGADKHQWGKSPFHYIDDYYQYALKFLQFER